MAIELIKNKKHIVIKRKGHQEPYQEEKMEKVIRWAVQTAFEKGIYKFQPINLDQTIDIFTKELLQDVKIKIFNKIKIEKLFDEVIKTASNKANRLQPIWDDIAKNLYIQKIYKETWGMKRNEYPHLLEVFKKGAQFKVLDKEFVEAFDEDEYNELNSYIRQERDFNFTLLGIRSFMKKYSLMHTKNLNLELPQHSIMRLAMFSFYKEPDELERMELIKERYDHINAIISEATPRWLNSGKPAAQMASCVLTAMKDDSFSINDTVSNIGLFSKYGGGTACDVSELRCKGSTIANSGVSSGPIPFIKKIEGAITAFNQLGKRPGACAVYFNWWHMDVMDMIMLKDEGGTEENRARKLQYGIKFNRIFFGRLLNDEEITLFDPKETPELIKSFGDEFEKWYIYYENKVGIRKTKIKASELAYAYAKVRSETGNLYVFFDDNANEGSPYLNKYINSSNLCTEIFLASEGSTLKSQKIRRNFGDFGNTNLDDKNDFEIDVTKKPGLIALCNLSSINGVSWSKLSNYQKRRVTYNLLRSHDNLIEYAYYPTKEAEINNKIYRPVGIGTFSIAHYFAINKVKFDDEKALRLQFDLMEDIVYHLIKASITLAKERGPFEEFYNSKWSKGWLPIDQNIELFELYASQDQKERWEALREEVKQGVRFLTLGAIAPTACQVKENKILTDKGNESIENILKRTGINYKNIELDNLIGWYNFNKPIKIQTRFGWKESEKIWFNGFKEVYEIEFEDGKKYKFTGNHQLLVKYNDTEKWIEVQNLKPDMEIIDINE